MEKEWKIFSAESCPNCGNNLEVFSDSQKSKDTEFEQYFTDGEEVRCCAECGFKSEISVDNAVRRSVYSYAITGTFHGSIVEAESEGKARRIFHKHYNGESITHICKRGNLPAWAY